MRSLQTYQYLINFKMEIVSNRFVVRLIVEIVSLSRRFLIVRMREFVCWNEIFQNLSIQNILYSYLQGSYTKTTRTVWEITKKWSIFVVMHAVSMWIASSIIEISFLTYHRGTLCLPNSYIIKNMQGLFLRTKTTVFRGYCHISIKTLSEKPGTHGPDLKMYP